MGPKTFSVICVTYILGFVISFGHAYGTAPAERITFTGQTMPNTNDQKATTAVMCAMFWPLYVSVELQKR